jgi:hypothetical protein
MATLVESLESVTFESNWTTDVSFEARGQKRLLEKDFLQKVRKMQADQLMRNPAFDPQGRLDAGRYDDPHAKAIVYEPMFYNNYLSGLKRERVELNSTGSNFAQVAEQMVEDSFDESKFAKACTLRKIGNAITYVGAPVGSAVEQVFYDGTRNNFPVNTILEEPIYLNDSSTTVVILPKKTGDPTKFEDQVWCLPWHITNVEEHWSNKRQLAPEVTERLVKLFEAECRKNGNTVQSMIFAMAQYLELV